MLLTSDKFCCGPFAQKRRRMAHLAIQIEQMRNGAVPVADLEKALREREIVGNWLMCHTCKARTGQKMRAIRY